MLLSYRSVDNIEIDKTSNCNTLSIETFQSIKEIDTHNVKLARPVVLLRNVMHHSQPLLLHMSQ